MKITSDAFQDNEPIPDKYGRAHDDVNPPLTLSETSVDTKSFALIMDDPDAPGRTFTHWVVYNMAPGTLQIIEGLSGYGEKSYGGPAPPSGTHRYIFTVFALDTELEPDEDMDAGKLRRAMDGHIIDSAQITGLYSAH